MPWNKGQSGNPKGRPPTRISARLKRAIAELESNAVEAVQEIVACMCQNDDLKVKLAAAKYVCDRIVPQVLQVEAMAAPDMPLEEQQQRLRLALESVTAELNAQRHGARPNQDN